MAKYLGAVVGIDNDNSNNKVYRVVLASIEPKANMQYNWTFKCILLSEEQLITTKVDKWLNIRFEGNKVVGSSGSLNRFNESNHKPYIILSELINSESKLLGYKVANYDGGIKNVPLKEMIAYGNRITKAGSIPVQNAIFVNSFEDRKDHFKSYPGCSFLKELIPSKKNTEVEKKRVQLQKNEKTLSKLDEIYSKEQLVQLKLGKEHGVDIRVYANPALKANQMKVLREGLEKGLNVKLFAFPEYDYMAMRYYSDCLENSIDIRQFLSPKYNIGQLSELSLAVELGLDITKMCNPKLKADEMAEIRERLERNIWKDWLVNKDGSWK